MPEDVNLLPLVKILPSPKATAGKRRLVRVVEGARLESVYTGNRIASSNLAVSANESNKQSPPFRRGFLFFRRTRRTPIAFLISTTLSQSIVLSHGIVLTIG